MHVFVLGLNHKTCPVALRERVSVSEAELPAACQAIAQLAHVHEVALVSTCNRTEVYVWGQANGVEAVRTWLCERGGFNTKQLSEFCYEWHQDEAIRHLFSVAVGLDSLVLGEPQILGQVKDAWRGAQQAGTLGSSLNRLFQQSFTLAKQVRTDTDIGAHPVSVAFAAVRLAERQFARIDEAHFLLIGAGDTIELAAQHIARRSPKSLTIANRTLERAVTLAEQHQGHAIPLTDLDQHLPQADVVISATASPTPIISAAQAEQAIKARRNKPMLFLDLAVPRDIEPSINQLNHAFLYSVDDLQEHLEENRQNRKMAAQQAESIIAMHTQRFQSWVQARERMNLITHIRGEALNQRDELLERAQTMLANGQAADETLQWLAHTLTQRLLHHPSAAMREAAMQGDQALLNAAQTLFQPAATSHIDTDDHSTE